jgi:hypothetical protein
MFRAFGNVEFLLCELVAVNGGKFGFFFSGLVLFSELSGVEMYGFKIRSRSALTLI